MVTAVALFCIGGYALYHYKKDSADGRLLIWKVTAGMMGKQPVLGNGAGAFRSDYLYAQAAYFAKNPDAPERMLADNTTSPFNEYLRIGYEQGLAALLLLAVSVCLTLCSPISPIFPILKAVLLSGVVICFFSYPLDIWCIKACLLIAFALSAKTLPPLQRQNVFTSERTRITRITRIFKETVNKKNPCKSVSSALSAFKIVNCLYAFCWCGFAAGLLFYASHVRHFKKGWHQTENAMEMFQASYPALHSNYEYRVAYANMLIREGNPEEVLKQMEVLARLSPSSTLFYRMGDLYRKERRYGEAEQHYRLAYYSMPATFVPLHRLMKLYIETEQTDKAKSTAETICRQPVKVKTNVTDRIKREAIEFLNENNNYD